MKRVSRIAAVLSIATLLAAAPAWGQSAEERETARMLFEDGKKKRDSGDKEGALEAFKAADALMNVPTTKLAVARAYLVLGRLVEARDAAVRIGQIPVAPKEPQPFADARSAASQLADDLGKRIPSVTFHLVGVPSDDEASVTIDGVAVPPAALGSPRKVNPGKHSIVAKLKEREEGTVKADISIAEAENKKVDLDVTELAKKPKKKPAQVATTTTPALTEPPREMDQSKTSPLVWIGGGLAIAGAGVGTAFGLMSMSDKATADESCKEGQCPPQAHDALDSANQNALISTIGFAAAGVGVGVAVVGLFLSKSSKSQTARTTPYVSASGAGLYGSF